MILRWPCFIIAPPILSTPYFGEGHLSRIRRIVSQRLKALRRDITQATLAKKAGVSIYVIGKIEREETTPSLETLYRLCQALDVSLAEFFSTAPPSQDSEEVIEALRIYLSTKKPENVQFADQIIRQIIERIESGSN